MKIYCSSCGIINLKRPGKQIRKIKAIGFDGIFIDLENYMDKNFPVDRAFSSIQSQCIKAEIACDIVRKQAGREKYEDIILSDDNFIMGNMCLVKNKAVDYNGHFVRGKCSEAIEILSYIDGLNSLAGYEKYGFCLDVGICNILGQNMYDFVRILGERIRAVILRDNDGYKDSALLPYTCAGRSGAYTDWLSLIRGLREIEYDGVLIMDFSDTAAAFPVLLRESILPIAYSIAEYFKWQISLKTVLKKYDTRILFGAGNMCRNYMKCYGEKFPPLFTCDNNEKRWGECFEGLEIKSPEVLRELDPDCAIFICNIYYREIEKQLREMGIINPVEYFNDEYMPSCYYDKLEYWEG